MEKYLVIDSETTGLNDKVHGIITLSALVCDDSKIVKQWHGINRDWQSYRIDIAALKVNGMLFSEIPVSENKFCRFYNEEDFIKDFAYFCLTEAASCQYLVGMNVQFDIGFIKEIFEKHNIDINGLLPKRQIDPLIYASCLIDSGMMKETKYLNSKYLYDSYKINSDKIHRSDVDAELTFTLWQKMKAEFAK